jgi:hypothetical protein
MKLAVSFLVAFAWLGACAEENPGSTFQSTSTTASSGGGPKVTPEANGVMISEEEACDKLLDAFSTGRTAACGTSTLPACPQFLRSMYQPNCMQYDEGAVNGCVDYFKKLKVCDDFIAEDCGVTNYPETAPAGCP